MQGIQASEGYGKLLFDQWNLYITRQKEMEDFFELDEMYTVLCQIEAFLNSRPITTISDNAKDTVPLTPSRLLKGFKSTQLPIVADPTVDKVFKDQKWPRQRFTYLHKLIAEFWKKQNFEYLKAMQQRKKNREIKQNLKKGDLVYITDDGNPLCHGHLESKKIYVPETIVYWG